MAPEIRRDVFQAIADPTRRQIIDIISDDTMNLNAIAEKFDITRSAVSQHIKILVECGIVEIEKRGRERFCKIQPRSLLPAFLWMEQHQKQWIERLDSFEKYITRLKTKKQKNEQFK